ncbi:MAG: mono/diheme cytochrome c family protein, partial [Planctomycetaceae bacterium]
MLPLLAAAMASFSAVTSAADADSATFYKEKVLPILEASCFECHGPESEVKGDLFLGNREGIMEGGESGPAVDTDAFEDSLILDAINYGSYEMPPDSQLPADEIAILTAWVKAGALIPEGSELERPEIKHANPATLVSEETKNYWAFRPVANPQVPQVKDSGRVSNPIDNFILQKLEAANLSPASPAEKQKLIRRAYYDLTGLPPSIDDIEAFVNDKSDRAFEKVIDR